MNIRRKGQAGHEKGVIEGFIAWYNSEMSEKFEIIGKPEPPDAILKSGDKILWVEHADIFRSGEEARDLWDLVTKGKEVPEDQEIKGVICDPDTKFVNALIKTLEKKLKKESYADSFEKYGEGILVLFEVDGLFTEQTLELIRRELKDYEFADDRGYFKEAYLRYRIEPNIGFERLYEK